MTSKTLAKKAAQFALSKKGYDLTLMDVRKLTSMTDFFLVCSADSDTQVRAVADAIRDGMDSLGERAWHTEGYSESRWILVDFVDVVVHVFHKETRAFYGIEKLWGDAKIEYPADKAEAPAAPKKIIKKKKTSA